MSSLRLSLGFAVAELRHEWQAALCFVAALVGVLVPLMVLLALKNGIVGTLVEELVDDPRNRQIIAVGAGAYQSAFFDDLRAREDVAFVMPATRAINAQADAVRNPSTRRLERGVELVPSQAGDPLVPQGAVTRGTVFLTQALADTLGATEGGQIQVIIERDIDGQIERARTDKRVGGIIPAPLYANAAVFMDITDLTDIERFRDSLEVTPDTWKEARPPTETFASFRLFVRELDDLNRVSAALDARGVSNRPRVDNAALLLGFKRNLNQLYAGIAVLAVAGFWAAMAANLRGMVERQRISFSLMSLVGMPRRGLGMVPLWQSVLLVLGGIAVTLCLVLPVLAIINAAFGSDARPVIAYLGAPDVVAVLSLGIVTALTACVWALAALSRISPDEVLRHA